MPENISFHVKPGGTLQGQFRVSGDKSISHRAIILGAIAEGTTRISGFLEAEDTLATLNAFRSMGVTIGGPNDGSVTIQGVGLNGLLSPEFELDLGNSGTAMRLLSGLLSGQKFDSVLIGDKSLSNRPMQRVTNPLSTMGAKITTSAQGAAPLCIKGGQVLKGIDYKMPVASAQVKSCLLLAGIYAQGKTCLTEPARTRDHTERMLEGFSYPLKKRGGRICIHPGGILKAAEIDIPGDISAAAFFIVGAIITPGSRLELNHVGMNPTRTGILDILRLMGATIEVKNKAVAGGEPVADLCVCFSPLKGIDIPEDLVSLAIDEFPIVFIAAACAKGNTRLKGAAELRVKESDRIQVMANGLNRLGIKAIPEDDGIMIQGGQLSGGEIDASGDHRVAMAFAMAGLVAEEQIAISNCENVNTSFPNFIEISGQLGLQIQVDSV